MSRESLSPAEHTALADPAHSAEHDSLAAVEHKPKKVDDEPLKIVLAGLNIDSFAKEAAHEKLSEQPEGRMVTKWLKNVWNNASHEYRLVKETQEAREAILASGNLLHHHGKSDKKWHESVVTRYSSDFGEALVREGETYHNLNSSEAADDPDAQRIRDDILNRVRQFARGDIMDAASLEEAHKRDRQAWKEDGVSQKYIGEGQILAHNIIAMGEQAKAALDNEEGLDAVDRDAKLEEMLRNAEVIVGEAKVGSQVEIESTLSERVAEKLQKLPFINEERFAKVAAFVQNDVAVAGVMSVAAYGATKAASVAAAVPGLGGGVVAAIRGRKRLRQERALMGRRMDNGDFEVPDKVELSDMTGKQMVGEMLGMGPNSTQAELKEVMDEAKPVSELMRGVGSLYDERGDLKMRTHEELVAAMAHLAEIQSRTESVDSGRRLISFAEKDIEERENLRWELDLAAAKLETDLKNLFENPAAAAMLDIKEDETFEALSSEQRELVDALLNGEMEQKDKLFNKLMRKDAFRTVVGGTFVGGAVGGVVNGLEGVFASSPSPSASTAPPDMQQLAFTEQGPTSSPVDQLGTDTVPDQLGSPEGSVPDQLGSETATPPESLGNEPSTPPEQLGDNGGAPEQLGTDNVESHSISETSNMSLPEGYETEVNGDQLTVTTADGTTIEGLELNDDGSLTAEAQDTLKDSGLNVVDTVDIVNSEPQVTQETVSAEAYVQNHIDEMKTIDHQGYMVNADPDASDANELKTQNYMDDNGNVIVDVSGMTEEGSFNGSSGVNWHEAAKDGLLTVDVSVSEGSQAHVFEIPIDPDSGQAVITPDNPAYALYNGEGMPTGGFQEINFNAGADQSGVEHVVTLSTVVGEHQDAFTDTVTTPGTPEAHHNYLITELGTEESVEPTFGTPPVGAPPTPTMPIIPLYGRQRMGKPGKPLGTPPTTPTTPATPGLPGTGGATTGGTGGGVPGSPFGGGPGSATPGSGAPLGLGGGPNAGANPNVNPGVNPNVNGNPNPGTTTPPSSAGGGNPAGIPGTTTAGSTNSGGAGTGATGGPTTSGAASAGAKSPIDEYASLNDADRGFMMDLDKEVQSDGKSFPDKFSFPNMRADFEERERVVARRAIDDAISELGPDADSQDVIARALEMIKGSTGAASVDLAPLYKQATSLLERSEAQVQKVAARAAKNKARGGGGTGVRYLADLDTETRDFPFENIIRNATLKVDQNIKNLVTRIYRDVEAKFRTENGPMPPILNLPFAPNKPIIQSVEAMQRYDEQMKQYKEELEKYNDSIKQRNNYLRKIVKKALQATHPDQYEGLSDDQRQLLNDASIVLTRAKDVYR